MAYKFNNGTFNITDDGTATESLAITGKLDADAAGTQTVTADIIDISGDAAVTTAIVAGSVLVHQDGAVANADLLLEMQNASSADLLKAGRLNDRAEIQINKSGNPRVKLHGSDINANAASLSVLNDSNQERIALTPGKLAVHRNLTMSGDLALTGDASNSDPLTLIIGGQLAVGGNLTADATNVTLLDKTIAINADAADKAASNDTLFKIGNASSVNTAQFKFDQGDSQVVIQAQSEAGDTSAVISVNANLIGDGTALTGIVPTLNYAVETTASPGTVTLSAANAGKVQLLSGNGAYTVAMPASAGLTVGQVFKIKAGADCGNAKEVTINANGSDRFGVDAPGGTAGAGRASIKLESPFAMVELVYMGQIDINSQNIFRFAIL